MTLSLARSTMSTAETQEKPQNGVEIARADQGPGSIQLGVT